MSEYCPWCGSLTREGHKFCRSCGRTLPVAEVDSASTAIRAPLSPPTLLPPPHPSAFESWPPPRVEQPAAAVSAAAGDAYQAAPPVTPLERRFTLTPRSWVALTLVAVALVVVLVIVWAAGTQPASSPESKGGSGGTGGGGGGVSNFTIRSVAINFSYPSGSSEFFGPSGINACGSACPAVFPNAQTCNFTAPIQVVGSVQIINQDSQTHSIDSVFVSPFGGDEGQVKWFVLFDNDQAQAMATPYDLGPGQTLPYSAVTVGLEGACAAVSGSYTVTITLIVS